MIDIEFELGDYVENQLTNTDGYVNAIADHITGCTRVGVRPRSEDRSENHKTEFHYPAELSEFNPPMDVIVRDDAGVPEDPEIHPGNVVEDEVTGITGLAVIVTYRMYNCPQVCIRLKSDDGYSTETEWIDAPRLMVVGDECVGKYEDPEGAQTGSVGDSMQEQSSMSEL
jgi:hypothetical protein